jgi:hypothetical protein
MNNHTSSGMVRFYGLANEFGWTKRPLALEGVFVP